MYFYQYAGREENGQGTTSGIPGAGERHSWKQMPVADNPILRTQHPTILHKM